MTIMTMGNFDGVHRGHQFILKTVVGRAKQEKTKSLVYTFNPHPVKILSPESPFTLIQTIQQRVAAITACGIDEVVVEAFTKEFAQHRATDFFKTVILDRIHPRQIFIGYDFTFGRHREGNVHLLYELGLKANITVTVIPAQFDGETLLSSSTVRQRIRSGDVDSARHLLGRPLELVGTIAKGRGDGKTLGFPTANLIASSECIPAPGIYATRFGFDHLNEPAVTYIGTNPTFSQTSLAIETHVLTPVPELLGKSATVSFLHRIRGEKKFSGPDALRGAIARDCQEALAYHAQNQ